MKIWLNKKIGIRKKFSSCHKKINLFYKKIKFDKIGNDIGVIQRFTKFLDSSYLLLFRIGENTETHEKIISFDLSGRLLKVKNILFFGNEHEVLQEQPARVKTSIIEHNDISEFGMKVNKLFKKK